MKTYINGEIVEMNEEQQAEYKLLASVNPYEGMGYGEVVNLLIRQKYSESEEFAILRQKDAKIEEFAEYNDFCEECKIKAKDIINEEE